MNFSIKKGDLLPTLTATLKTDGVVVDLTTAETVRFRFRRVAAPQLSFEGSATIVGNPTSGKVNYAWQTGDTALEGTYNGEFIVTWAGDLPETYPSDSFMEFNIIKSLSVTP